MSIPYIANAEVYLDLDSEFTFIKVRNMNSLTEYIEWDNGSFTINMYRTTNYNSNLFINSEYPRYSEHKFFNHIINAIKVSELDLFINPDQ
jgi:hypothetical protein